MKMTPEEFHAWSQGLQFTSEAMELYGCCHHSPPSPALSVRTATGCTFTEVIAVTPSQMEAVEVSRFECPTCLAVREIHPKGETMKFPWHQKRVTNTPNHGVRWVKRESGWSLSE